MPRLTKANSIERTWYCWELNKGLIMKRRKPENGKIKIPSNLFIRAIFGSLKSWSVFLKKTQKLKIFIFKKYCIFMWVICYCFVMLFSYEEKKWCCSSSACFKNRSSFLFFSSACFKNRSSFLLLVSRTACFKNSKKCVLLLLVSRKEPLVSRIQRKAVRKEMVSSCSKKRKEKLTQFTQLFV